MKDSQEIYAMTAGQKRWYRTRLHVSLCDNY